ncbi:MAG: VOC family protein [candidate division Zixibacteria bacterium]|nr:VOC family protein [candidate division Zixibacteria bacterium]
MKLDRVVIKAADYRKSFEFYHDILGLRLKTSWQRSDSWGALFYCGEALFEIIWFPDGDGNADCNYIPKRNKTEFFLAVNNVDTIYHRLKAFDGLELSAPEDMPWGMRISAVFDPDGIKVVFSQPI